MDPGAGDVAEPLGRMRQTTIDSLCEHFANDHLQVEDFERRVEVAHRAASADELKELLRDLPAVDLPARRAPEGGVSPRPRARAAVAAHAKSQEMVVAVMGGATRKGRWSPARRNFAFALMGGAELDFREAVLPPGVTDVQVFAIMGGVEIVVPPGVNVESHGFGIMGGFDDVGGHEYDDAAPTLRIAGLALMGGVEITVRYPGESAREAKRRQKQESKERRRLRDSWE